MDRECLKRQIDFFRQREEVEKARWQVLASIPGSARDFEKGSAFGLSLAYGTAARHLEIMFGFPVRGTV